MKTTKSSLRKKILLLIIISTTTLNAYTLDSQKMFIEDWERNETDITENFLRIKDSFDEICYFSKQRAPRFNYDVTLVGFVNDGDGIGSQPILFKQCLEPKATINFLSTRNIPYEQEDAFLGLPRLNPSDYKNVGAISILTDIIADKALNIYEQMPDSIIKIAYTKFESTEIPYNWAEILNNNFDMAVVPDPFLVDVYKKNGVKIPVFVLPLPLQLDDYLKMKRHHTDRKPFVFGFSGGFWGRKNHLKVIDAFAQEFGNDSNVKLLLHGRFGEKYIIDKIIQKIAEYKLTNVELIAKPLDHFDHLKFFESLDCYVSLSMGEGFAATPREALASGIPCILTENTSQTIICNTGFVRVVPSKIQVPAMYDCHAGKRFAYENKASFVRNIVNKQNQFLTRSNIDIFQSDDAQIGYQLDCTTEDARTAMRDVYNNYEEYSKLTQANRYWTERYLKQNLSKKYLSLVKPASVVMGKSNIIGDSFLMTNSADLFDKYKYLLGH